MANDVLVQAAATIVAARIQARAVHRPGVTRVVVADPPTMAEEFKTVYRELDKALAEMTSENATAGAR